MIKYIECGKPFKEDERVVITHGDMWEPVHEGCHYRYLLGNRLMNTVSYDEYKREMNK